MLVPILHRFHQRPDDIERRGFTDVVGVGFERQTPHRDLRTFDRPAELLNDLLDEALKAAEKIAGFSLPAVMMAKETINRSYETTLSEGLRFERRIFHSMFALEDQKEGMGAFAEKRPAAFRNR